MQMQPPATTETTNESDLVKVEILCADCRDGNHGCAGLWRGIGLEIRCSCRCIDWNDRTAAAAENVTIGGRC
ncbi:MAG: hypothetical protein M3275_13790 [Thermoproteota archaeon]|nr:hypothetical protein [Thermoproteota archaeon]